MFSKIKIITVFLVLACSGAVQAQDPTSYTAIPSHQRIETWLHSDEPRLQAWAAFFILKTNDTSARPDLLSFVEQSLSRNTALFKQDAQGGDVWRDHYLAMDAALDTLIQMNVNAPVPLLQRLAEAFPAQAIVLLSRKPYQEAEPALLAMYYADDQEAPEIRRAAAALLALHPPAGFAASLFASITITLDLAVALRNDPGVGKGGGYCAGCFGPWRNEPMLGWPKV